MKKTILFIHQSFPGQFLHLSKKLAEDGHRVVALTLTPQGEVDGVTQVRYTLKRAPQKNQPLIMQETDSKVLRGESAAIAMQQLKEQGFTPDIVYAHPGWGEALFVKTVWPATRLVVYAEWFYNAEGQEVDFDPEFPLMSPEDKMRLRLKNIPFLQALNDADLAITPTQWQKSRYPLWAQDKIQVVHDGLDINRITLGVPKAIHLPEKKITLKYGDPIVTFATRYLEPVRGFHTFMRALPQILRRRPDAQIIILGQDPGEKGGGYGSKNPLGKSWHQSLLDEIGKNLDLTRVHFFGRPDFASYLSFMRLSACHVYLTTPFILSWSFLEAAALGLPIVASRTAPVLEFSNLKGLELVDFFDHAALSQKVVEVLDRPVLRTPNLLAEHDINITVSLVAEMVVGEKSPGVKQMAKIHKIIPDTQANTPAVKSKRKPAAKTNGEAEVPVKISSEAAKAKATPAAKSKVSIGVIKSPVNTTVTGNVKKQSKAKR